MHMEEFVHFFQHMTSVQKFAWVVLCLSVFWIAEGVYPLFGYQYRKWRHARLNLILLGTTILINLLFGLATVAVFEWTELQKFGLLHLIELPLWLELILAVMLLDLIAQYTVHFLLHRISFMWRFHMVHHSDTHVDVTTGTRHHPGDYIFRELFALIAIIIVGIPLAFYIFYRILTVFFAYFSHSNISLPESLDKAISYLFISPNMHKFHHHFERPWTDSNFGNMFSLWDRIFGTFIYADPNQIRYGLDVLDDENSDFVVYQLKVPFDRSIKTDY